MKEIEKRTDENDKIKKRASLAIMLSVAVPFLAIIVITYIVEYFFGKTAGTVALVLMAAVLALILYRKEIGEFLRRRR